MIARRQDPLQVSHRLRRALLAGAAVLTCLVIMFAAPIPRLSAQIDRTRDPRALPAPMCGLVGTRLFCYLAKDATPRPLTPEDQPVLDFAVAPDGEWVVYRTEEGAVRVASIYANEVWAVEDSAIAPAAFARGQMSIAWSPDGLAIAYVTADGIRLVLPTLTGPQFDSFNDRLYVNLRFSPGGARLAVQDDNGKWTVFSAFAEAGIRQGFRRAGAFEREADAAWLDDNSLILAPKVGGLIRVNVADSADPNVESSLITAWERPENYFVRMVHAVDGRVLALQVSTDSAGADIGLPVAIGGDGAVTPLGENKVDLRVDWLAGGRYLAYLTGGTPLLINPETGREDALPLHNMKRIAWGAPDLLTAGSLALDADLFYIAPDEDGVSQVWHLPGDGLTPLRQITRIATGVVDFAISPNRRLIAIITGDQLGILPLEDTSTATPTPSPFGRRFTPTPQFPPIADVPGSRFLTTINRPASTAPIHRPLLDWRPDGQQIAVTDADGVTLVDLPGASATTPRVVQFASGDGYAHPQFSPDQAYLLVERASPGAAEPSTMSALPLNLNAPPMAGDPLRAVRAVWGLNALFSIQRTDQKTGVTWQLFASDSAGSATLVSSPWEILDVRPLGGAPGAAGQSGIFMRLVGWPNGPSVIQFAATSPDPAQPEIRGAPVVLGAPLVSPSGRFVAGLLRARDGKINQLVVLDLQNGRRVAIRNVTEISGLRWVR